MRLFYKLNILILLINIYIQSSFACVGFGPGCYINTMFNISYVDTNNNTVRFQLPYYQHEFGRQLIANIGDHTLRVRIVLSPGGFENETVTTDCNTGKLIYNNPTNVPRKFLGSDGKWKTDPNRSGCASTYILPRVPTPGIMPGSYGLTNYDDVMLLGLRGTCTTQVRTIEASYVGAKISGAYNLNDEPKKGPIEGWALIQENVINSYSNMITPFIISSVGLDLDTYKQIVLYLIQNPNTVIYADFPASGPLIDQNELKFLSALSNTYIESTSYYQQFSVPIQFWNKTSSLVSNTNYKWLFDTRNWFASKNYTYNYKYNFNPSDNNNYTNWFNDPYLWDPCVGVRISFVSCYKGRIWDFKSQDRNGAGSIPIEINYLTQLEYLRFTSATSIGTLPDINLPNLIYLEFYSCSIPSISISNWAKFPRLLVLSFGKNALTTIPTDVNTLNKLQYLVFDNNKLTNFIIPTSTDLLYYDLSVNSINYNFVNTPLFLSTSSVKVINLSYNNFTGIVENTWKNLVKLVSIDLSSNKLEGRAPWFSSRVLQSVSLNDNLFSGEITDQFDVPALTYLSINKNKITGPFNFVLNPLTYLDLSYNSINISTDAWKSSTGGLFQNLLSCCFPANTIQSLNLGYNLISSQYLQANIGPFAKLNQIIVNNNFLFGTFSTSFFSNFVGTYVDFSNNNFVGDWTTVPPDARIKYVNFAGNPQMRAASSAFITQFAEPTSLFLQANVDDKYICPSLIRKGNKWQQIVTDAAFYNFANCKCYRGYYGNAPNCLDIPSYVSMNKTSVVADITYGNQRLLSGMDTNWIIIVPNTNVYSFYVTLNPDFWIYEKGYSNILTLSSGCPTGFNYNPISQDCSCVSGQVFSVDEKKCIPKTASSSMNSFSYIIDSSYSNIPSTVNVLDKISNIRFKSKKTDGNHFSVNITTSAICPDDYQYFEYIENGQLISSRCEKVFNNNMGISASVYAVSALFTIILIVLTAIVVQKRNSLIIKSSSFPFCFCMLVFMTILSASGIFYAISPKTTPAVCHLRPWFTALPLTCILSALLVKADRIRKIFGSKQLVVQAISNAQLFKTMCLMLSGQLAILLWFSTAPVSGLQISIGTGSTSGYLVYSCKDASPSWIAIQFSYVSLFLLAGVLEAWGVRKVPSAFNEGPHIASTLLSLTVLLIILIPVQFMVGDNPDALVIIRGIGQVLVSTVMAFFLFGPKLYYILEGKENDKTLSSVGSSKSSSSSSSFSSSSNNSSSVNPTTYLQSISVLFQNVADYLENIKSGKSDPSSLDKSLENFKSNIQTTTDYKLLDQCIERIKKLQSTN